MSSCANVSQDAAGPHLLRLCVKCTMPVHVYMGLIIKGSPFQGALQHFPYDSDGQICCNADLQDLMN